jgi:hypothetical protein
MGIKNRETLCLPIFLLFKLITINFCFTYLTRGAYEF